MTCRPPLTRTTGSQPAVLIVDDQTSVQLQLVEGSGCTWPTEVRDLEQRYADAPPARMAVLTAPAAAAAKLAAWIGRRAPRDLYDLWALAERGLITPEAVAVFVARGPFGQPPREWVFTAGIDERDWRSGLGPDPAVHPCRSSPGRRPHSVANCRRGNCPIVIWGVLVRQR